MFYPSLLARPIPPELGNLAVTTGLDLSGKQLRDKSLLVDAHAMVFPRSNIVESRLCLYGIHPGNWRPGFFKRETKRLTAQRIALKFEAMQCSKASELRRDGPYGDRVQRQVLWGIEQAVKFRVLE